MLKCHRCKGKVFVDRQYTTVDHLETYCIKCGLRIFFHPPSSSKQGTWILQKEKLRAKHIIMPL